LGVSPRARHKKYYKGEGGGLPSLGHGEFYEFVFAHGLCTKRIYILKCKGKLGPMIAR